ncbi:ApaG domain-containing protein [Tribonema minus]|uniref:ApaG domain-containing protein n=1 Tax=Tribonema minus TaxID=303371 RepID=A0A836CAE5_9STRA|nr:ApaG domain-containing protein [Tribonema minus]
MPGQSMGTNNIFYYKMRIDNRGDHTVQLLARHLVFSSATAAGEPLEVMMQVPKWRDGVVGEQPILRPGEAFEYCSSAPSWAPHSVMSGSYQFEILEGPGGVEGELFEAEIAPLRLIMDQPTT